ncbi:unnamed protein product [Cylindrotheca closterium]|uniref:Glycosyl transferase 64 domain-containing protein n=1 Tax=Cylindrotheca closterium TaxID=2856 RepID=A0AAD2FBZ0_9STRA|nr:unnamed protein product [Cylindrotheca closterium]
MPSQHEISKTIVDGSLRKDSDPSACKDDLNSSFDTASTTTSTVLDSSYSYSENDLYLVEPIPLCRSRPSFGSCSPSSSGSSRSSSSSSTRTKEELTTAHGSEMPNGCYDKGKAKQRAGKGRLISIFLLAAGTIAFIRSIVNDPGSGEGGERYNTWMHFMNNEAGFLKHKIAHTTQEKQFTILLKGDRIDFIHQSIDAHSACSSVKEIQLDFGSSTIPDRTLARDDKVTTSRIVHTNAVLLLSQDVLLSCEELDKAFDAWKSDTSRLVGFFGYQQTPSSDTFLRSTISDRLYSAVQTGSGAYSVVSDKAVFANTLYIDSIPTYDYRSSSCQLLLSLQVSAISGKAPQVIKSNPRMLSSGVVEEEGSECVNSWLQVHLSQGASTLM